MTDKEIITKLKNKDTAQAFGICTLEERIMYRKAGKENCVAVDSSGNWRHPNTLDSNTDFDNRLTYAIKPDWEPEQGYEDRPVYIDKDGLCRTTIPRTKDTWNVMVAAGDKDFEEYYYLNKMYCVAFPHKVSSHMADGKTVFGRFRKA